MLYICNMAGLAAEFKMPRLSPNTSLKLPSASEVLNATFSAP